MRKNIAKEKIKNGGTAVGCFCNLYAPTLVEALGHVGYDFVLLDSEHGPVEVESCESMVRAADAVGIVPLIRVAQNVRQVVLRYLDIGALGVQLPMVNTKEEAESVVQSVKYPPEGQRGLAAVRAADYGITGPLGEYVKMANRETMVVTQVETMQAVANLPEMLAVEGIDVFFIGPTDLSSSMGLPGQVNHPEVQAMIEKLVKQIRDAGKAAGTIAYDLDALKKCKERGFQYIVYGILPMVVRGARDYLAVARS